MLFYIYILESLSDNKHYTGYTSNLKRRLEEHSKGKSFATKFRLPFKLIYFEGCLHSEDAKRREMYLKTSPGRKFLGLRLIHYNRTKQAVGIKD
jgi:putative endonuclease